MTDKKETFYEQAKSHGIIEYLVELTNFDCLVKKTFSGMTTIEYLDHLYQEFYKGDMNAASILWLFYNLSFSCLMRVAPNIPLSEADIENLQCCLFVVNSKIDGWYEKKVWDEMMSR